MHRVEPRKSIRQVWAESESERKAKLTAELEAADTFPKRFCVCLGHDDAADRAFKFCVDHRRDVSPPAYARALVWRLLLTTESARDPDPEEQRMRRAERKTNQRRVREQRAGARALQAKLLAKLAELRYADPTPGSRFGSLKLAASMASLEKVAPVTRPGSSHRRVGYDTPRRGKAICDFAMWLRANTSAPVGAGRVAALVNAANRAAGGRSILGEGNIRRDLRGCGLPRPSLEDT